MGPIERDIAVNIVDQQLFKLHSIPGTERQEAEVMLSQEVNFRSFSGIRTIIDTPVVFDEVVRRLKSEMGDASIPGIIALAKEARTESEYINEVTKRYVGRSGFMLFAEIDHGGWLPAFGIKRKTLRLIFGNPLIAITMIRYDITAGLFAPVEVLVTEHEDGKGTNLVYVQPSTLIVVDENEALSQAAKALDTKLSALVTSAAAV